MQRRFFFVLVAALLGLAAGTTLAAEAPQVVRLNNGLTVVTLEDNRFPLVSMRLFVHTGSGYESPKQAGLSHLLEHMVFKSTARRPAGQVASDVEGAGGAINASTGFDATTFKIDLPAERWKLGLDILNDMIFGAKFDAKELESERKVVLAELYRGRDDPDSRLFQTIQAKAWAGKSYGWPVIGFPETVSSFTGDDLRAYVAEHYQPGAMVLVVAGKVTAAEVRQQAETVFGSLRDDHPWLPPAPFAPAVGGAGPSVTVEYGQWNKVRLQVAFPTPGLRSAEEAPLEVLAHLLGGDETGRLYRTFKHDKQLVDDVSCSSLTLERGGLFLIEANLDAKNLAAFWKGLLSELSHLSAAGFSDREIERAKLAIEDGLYQTKESLSGLATKLGYFRFYGYDPDGEANFLQAVRLVDRGSLQSVIGASLRPGNLVAAVLAPKTDEGLVTAKGLTDAAAKVWSTPAQAATAPAAEAKAGGSEVVDLGGGHTLVLLPDTTLPYVSVSLAMRGGDGLLAKNQQGLAELAADCLTSGTAKLPSSALEDYLGDRAATISAASGRDSFSLGAKFPSRFQKDLYGVLSELLLAPAFRQEEVARSVSDQLASIKSKEDEPLPLAFRKLYPFLFTDTAYAYERLGDPAVVRRFTQKDVKAFWAAQREMPWVMAVCGDFDPAQVRRLAEDLAKATKAARPFDYSIPHWGDKREEKVSLPGRNQTHLVMVFPVPGVESPDTPALELLNESLAGQSGLLFSRLRDGESLGYVVTSFLWQTAKTGFLAFYIGTSPDKVGAAVDGFKRVASDLRETPLPDELMLRAKNAMSGDYYRERQGLGARSGEAARSLVAGLPLDHERQVVEAAQQVTPEALRDVAAKYLHPESAYLLTVEP
jgi:zinc protease